MQQTGLITLLFYVQVESAPNSAPMLEVARKLRQERDRDNKLQNQKHEQRNFVSIGTAIYLLKVVAIFTKSY